MFKKFNKKSLFLFLGIVTIVPIIVIPTVTSCSKTNPFTNLKVGDNIVVSSKNDAKNLKSVAESHIKCASDPISPTDNILFTLLTGLNSIDHDAHNAYASSQIYWEIAYFLCEHWSKNDKQTLTFSGDFPIATTGNKTFVDVNTTTSLVVTTSGTNALAININGTDWAKAPGNLTGTAWMYEKDSNDSKYKLSNKEGSNLSQYRFDSYACKIWN